MDAWAVIVQQASILQDVGTVCRLLCVCKELNALVKAKCAGQVPVAFHARSSDHELQFAHWLGGSHCIGSKLLSAHLELHLLFQSNDSLLETFEEMPAMDQEAAAQASAAVLEQLPAATQLTHLSLMRNCFTELAACSGAMQALAGLTGLRSISIGSRDWTVCAAALFPALQSLSCLSSLSVNRIISVGKLQHLPQSLRCLDIGVCSPGINLSHLTGLTALRADKLFALGPGDVLPPQLQQLDLGEINSVQRLVGLTGLASLSAWASHIPARRLLRVAKSLKQLTQVRLCYQFGINEAAEAWPLLPLQHLELMEVDALSNEVISATTLQQLACLTQLTYLHIQRLDCVEADTWQLAVLLGQLRQLRGLRLWAAGPWPLLRRQQHDAAAAAVVLFDGVQPQHQQQQQQQQQQRPQQAECISSGLMHGHHDDLLCNGALAAHHAAAAAPPPATAVAVIGVPGGGSSIAASAAPAAATTGHYLDTADAAADAGNAALMRAVASLPHLSSLSLSLQGLGCSAAAELAAAMGLTSLKLRACGLDNVALAGLARRLKCLRCLFAEYNRELDDCVLPVLQLELPQLTELDVRYTGVSEAGRQYLRTLDRLKQLQV